MQEDMNQDFLEGRDEDGNILSVRVERYFFFNGEEYVLLKPADEQEKETSDLYVMQVEVVVDEDGEEWEEFVPVSSELMDDLIRVAATDFREDEELIGLEDEQP